MKAPEKKQCPTDACKHPSILVAEDNIANQRVICIVLEKAGYSFDVVVDGRAAIEALESKAYDLVLMDCLMPVMDGFSATRSIRAPGSRVLDPDIPIIAVTALAMKGDKEKCLEAGMNYYLSKPVEPEKLISTIERFLAPGFSQESTATNKDTPAASSNPTKTNPDLNTTTTQAGLEMEPELLDTIIDLYLEDTPTQISRIEAAVQNKDYDELLAVCHKVRGSSGVLGTKKITILALAAEQAGRQEDFEQAAGFALKLVVELKNFLAELTSQGGSELD